MSREGKAKLMSGSFHIVVDAVIILAASIGIALLMLGIVRRLVPSERLKPHNEVSGFVYAAIGVIYAVILGFVVVTVWQDYQEAKAAAHAEANAARDLHRISNGLSEPSRAAMHEALVAYAIAVIDGEWPAMLAGDASGVQTNDEIDALWLVVYNMEITTLQEAELYDAMIEQLIQLINHRRERLEDAGSGLLSVMWAVMIGGALLTVLFPCLFGVENGIIHSLIIATLAASIGLLLFVAYALDRPFSGDMYVPPDDMTVVLDRMLELEH